MDLTMIDKSSVVFLLYLLRIDYFLKLWRSKEDSMKCCRQDSLLQTSVIKKQTRYYVDSSKRKSENQKIKNINGV